MTDELPPLRRDHIMRPDLPWRINTLVECGREKDDVTSTITRDEFLDRLHTLGKQRTAFTICMTCATTTERWDVFSKDPVSAVQREMALYKTGRELLAIELRALAALVEAHREEFDEFIAGHGQTVDLLQARRDKRGAGRAW